MKMEEFKVDEKGKIPEAVKRLLSGEKIGVKVHLGPIRGVHLCLEDFDVSKQLSGDALVDELTRAISEIIE